VPEDLLKKKKKKSGLGSRVCRRCGRRGALIRKYNLYYCRQRFDV